MYKVFLVEDELFVLESLKAIINWQEYGFELTGEAFNGIDALEKIIKVKPDIVFTDIVMPRMNGLELIQKVKEADPAILFVVLSGFAEFSYAQKVFNYGGIGYCLKPFDENEIIAVLKKARDILDKNRKILEFNLLEIISEKQGKTGEKLDVILSDLGLDYQAGNGYVVLVSIGSKAIRMPDSQQSLVIKLGLNKYAYIIKSDSRERIWKYLEDNYSQYVKGVGISEVSCSMELLRDKIVETTLAAYKFFLTGKSGVYESAVLEPEDVNIIFHDIDEAMEKKELSLIIRSMNKAAEIFSMGTCSAKNVFRYFNIIMSYVSRLENYSFDEYSYNYEELFNTFGGINEMMDYLKKLLEQVQGTKTGILKEEIKNATFTRILKYIDENYQQDINLQYIARNYCINPSYISQLFKKELDTTYTDYITGLRVKYAENILRTTSMNITEVSEKAGYNDYFYFAKVFKKITGKTPTEFKHTYNK